MRILITGSSGLIGSHLAEKLISQHHEVYGISRTKKNPIPGLNTYCCDLRWPKETEDIIKEIKPEIVYHLSANAAEALGQFSPINISSNGYQTFYNVLVPCINNGMKRFVYVSSAAVYGSAIPPFREGDKCEPEDIYAVSKLSNEMSLKIMANVHGFEYVILRPHNIFGPRQNMNDPYRNVVTIFINKLLHGLPFTIYGNGNTYRCFSYVKDVTEAISKTISANVSGLIINVGSDHVITIKQLADMVQEVSEIKIPPLYLPLRPQEVSYSAVDHTLCKDKLGYTDTDFKEALKETWEYCKSLGPQESNFIEPEITSNLLPANWVQK